MAMHSAVLLACENKELQAANEKQKKKQERVRSCVAHRGVLTAKERLYLAKNQQEAAKEAIQAAQDEPKQLAPPRCSICKFARA